MSYLTVATRPAVRCARYESCFSDVKYPRSARTILREVDVESCQMASECSRDDSTTTPVQKHHRQVLRSLRRSTEFPGACARDCSCPPAEPLPSIPSGGRTSISHMPAPGRRRTYLYAIDLAKKTQKIFPLQVDGDPGSFRLSPCGSGLILTANPRIVGGQPVLTATPTIDVWVLDLESEKQFKLFSFISSDAVGTKGPWINLIGWLQDQ